LRPLLTAPELDPAAVLAAMRAVEAELTALSGSYEPDLVAAIVLVSAVFSGARVIQLK